MTCPALLRLRLALPCAAALLLAACAAPPALPPPVAAVPPPIAPPPKPVLLPAIDTDVGRLVPVAWSELVDFDTDPLDDVGKAFRFSCQYLARRPQWAEVCARLAQLGPSDAAGLRSLLKAMQPYRVQAKDGDAVGTITGYFEPVLRGSRVARNPYLYPLYSRPVDLVSIDPKNHGGISRGRLEGAKVLPYWTRAQMLTPEGQKSMSGREIVWVDDPMDDVLIEVQGSGRVLLPDGSAIRLTYIDHNGWPFKPLFQWFKQTGTLKNPNMVQISQWARSHSYQQVLPMLNSNPQVVFFKWEPVKDVTVGPPGAAGVPLVPMRSIAVDPKSVPLAAPVWIDFKSPISDVQYRRLVFAHDTGGAIKGAVRADYFWGFGQQAGELAAKTRQTAGRMWVLLPKP